MKIGILTFHAACNFGANLQAYASACIYQRLGHQPKIINYIRPGDINYINSVNAKQFKAHHDFALQYLPLTRQISSTEELLQVVKEEKFELISIGADAVWRTPNNEKDLVFFGYPIFKESKFPHVVAMSAAHMGQGFSNLSSNLRNQLKNCLEKYSYISVRDEWTRKKINEDIFGHDYVKIINPDPVIWLNDFIGNEHFSLDEELKSRPYYLMSLPIRCDSSHKIKKWFREFKHLVNSAGFSLVELPLPEGISGLDFDYIIKYPINPIHWFCYINQAHAFCGLRFHAIMACISSGTPFFSIDSYGNSSKLLRIIKMIGMYQYTLRFDKMSKIRNLLHNSDFEKYRVQGDITQIPAKRVFDMLEKFDRQRLISFRDSMRQLYTNNINQMFNTLKHED